jgi:hypothetical protein
MIRLITFICAVLTIFSVGTSTAAYGADNSSQRLVIPVPDTSGIPKEKITLTIRIPEKIDVVDDMPKARKRVKTSAWDAYDFRPFRTIPRQDFIFKVFRQAIKLGLLKDRASKNNVTNHVTQEIIVVEVLKRLHLRLVDVADHDALRKLNVTTDFLDDVQEVIELLKGRLHIVRLSQTEMNRRIDEMIGFLRKTSGKGHLRIVEVKEKPDGSTILELELLKE